jgi:hypothetical protein
MSKFVAVKIECLAFDYRFSESDLRREFSAFGSVKDVMLLDEQLIPDIAIIEFASAAEAIKAVESLNNSKKIVEGYTGILRLVELTPPVERALLVKAHMLSSTNDHPEDDNRFIDPFDHCNTLNRFTCRYVVGAERMNQEYSVIGRILGVGGENVKGIFRSTGCHVRINGKQRGGDEPLHVRVSAENQTSFLKGREMTEQLIREMYDDYAKWCERHYVPVTPVRLRVVEGAEALRPLNRLIDYAFS